MNAKTSVSCKEERTEKTPPQPVVGLFVTCLVDLFRPQIAIASTQLLRQAGCKIIVPTQQSCCGQPGYNSGDFASAKAVVRPLLDAFAEVDYLVTPSGSCAAMLRHHLIELFDQDNDIKKANELAAKSWELASFLTEIMDFTIPDTIHYSGSYCYHDSCSGLRELDIKQAPRSLLNNINKLHLKEMNEPETCCGFGGTFCVKYPEVSDHMVSRKLADASFANTDLVLAGDLGCLLNMAGKASRQGSSQRFFHYVEILADMGDLPAIGEADHPSEKSNFNQITKPKNKTTITND